MRAAVGDLRIKEIRVHAPKRLRMAEEVPLVADDLADRLDGERCVADLDRGQRAQDRAQHVVVDDVALERAAHQPSLHPAGLRDHVAAGMGGERDGEALLVAALGVGELAVAGAGDGRVGQPVMLRHLHGGCGQQGLLAAASRHRSRAQVRHHRARPEYDFGARIDQIGQHHSRDRLGYRLRYRTRDRHRARCAELAEAVDVHWDAEPDRLDQDADRVGGEPQRRHHVVDIEREERSCPEGFRRTRDRKTQLADLCDVGGRRCAHRDVLGGARQGRKGRIEIEAERIRQVACDERAAEELDMLERVDEACRVMEVAQGRRPIGAALQVDDIGGCPARADVYPFPCQLDLSSRLPAMKLEPAWQASEGALDERPREQQATVVGDASAGVDDERNGLRRRFGEADGREDGDHRFVHSREIGRGERLELATAHDQGGAHAARRAWTGVSPGTPAAAGADVGPDGMLFGHRSCSRFAREYKVGRLAAS